MLLEQQNKKRLLMARQEQDSMAHPSGPNGAAFQPAMSPSNSRAGDPSPNPNDMQRGTPNIKKAGMSPQNGDMAGRGSPAPNMMDPAMRQQMMMGQNGQPMMRPPPSSHPAMGGQMTQQQMEFMQRGQMMQNGGWQGGPQPPHGMMPQPGQPGQQPNMTPRQGNMPPPPAPPVTNTGGTQPSSPAQQPQPPTPSQANKPKPGGKKDNKKVCTSKSSDVTCNANILSRAATRRAQLQTRTRMQTLHPLPLHLLQSLQTTLHRSIRTKICRCRTANLVQVVSKTTMETKCKLLHPIWPWVLLLVTLVVTGNSLAWTLPIWIAATCSIISTLTASSTTTTTLDLALMPTSPLVEIPLRLTSAGTRRNLLLSIQQSSIPPTPAMEVLLKIGLMAYRIPSGRRPSHFGNARCVRSVRSTTTPDSTQKELYLYNLLRPRQPLVRSALLTQP